MPDVRLPNGVIVRNVPEDMNKYSLMEMAIRNGAAKPEDFGQDYIDPTKGMSGYEKFMAGVGKGFVDIGRGVGQLIGVVDEEDVARSRERDAPLMRTGAGLAGNITGNIAAMAPAAFIPGANTVTGSALIGAGAGLIQPAESMGERMTNAGVGGALGFAVPAAVKTGSAVYRGGKALLDPFSRGGQDRILGRTLQAFAGGSDEAARAADSIDDSLRNIRPPAGVRPTTAEVANNPGMAQFERTLRNNPTYNPAITQRLQENRGAMMSTLDQMAGTEAKRSAIRGARQSATQSLYRQADDVVVQADQKLASLMQRPAAKEAWNRAQQLAANEGRELVTDDQLTGRGLHYFKRALDDMADATNPTGLKGNELRAVQGIRDEVRSWLNNNIPDFGRADQLYSRFSRPLNQMDIAEELRNRVQPALADFGGNARTRAESYARALRDGDRTAARATGYRSARMDRIMSPRQMDRLKRIGQQLARRANADDLGRAPGSNTGQNLVSQNFLRQFMGPMGLPDTWVERIAQSAIGQKILQPIQFVGDIGEQQIRDRLLEAALDPQMASEWLKIGLQPDAVARVLQYQTLALPVALGTNAARE